MPMAPPAYAHCIAPSPGGAADCVVTTIDTGGAFDIAGQGPGSSGGLRRRILVRRCPPAVRTSVTIIFICTRLHPYPRSCFFATLPHACMTQVMSLPPLDVPCKCAANMTPGTRARFPQPGTLVGVEYTASSS